MRQSFDRKVPYHEQLLRIIKSHTGHKHMHRKGPGRKSNEEREQQRRRVKLEAARWRKFKLRVGAYWRGETDEHP